MINIDQRLAKEKMKSMMIMQVHDELVFEVPEKEADSISKLVQEEMENVWDLKVPLVAEAKTGENWLEAHP